MEEIHFSILRELVSWSMSGLTLYPSFGQRERERRAAENPHLYPLRQAAKQLTPHPRHNSPVSPRPPLRDSTAPGFQRPTVPAVAMLRPGTPIQPNCPRDDPYPERRCHCATACGVELTKPVHPRVAESIEVCPLSVAACLRCRHAMAGDRKRIVGCWTLDVGRWMMGCRGPVGERKKTTWSLTGTLQLAYPE